MPASKKKKSAPKKKKIVKAKKKSWLSYFFIFSAAVIIGLPIASYITYPHESVQGVSSSSRGRYYKITYPSPSGTYKVSPTSVRPSPSGVRLTPSSYPTRLSPTPKLQRRAIFSF